MSEEVWADDIKYNEDIIFDIISKETDLQVSTIEFMGNGWDNCAFLVNSEFVFRFTRRNEGISFMENELCFFEHKPKLPIPTPTPIYQGYYIKKWPWCGYRKLRGVTGELAKLSDDDKIKFARPLGNFLKILHKVNIHQFPQLVKKGDWLGHTNVPYRLTRIFNQLSNLEDMKLIDKAENFFYITDEVQNIPYEDSKSLVHGDFKTAHLLIENNLLSGIIDWGDVHVGHPAADISICYSFLPPPCHKSFWEEYGQIPETWKKLARFRALFHQASICEYASKTNKKEMLAESLQALEWLRKITS